ncbi:hypothetical protein M404DRAFT_993896 [Pisolithus tinctorius Marx 270]|uniref:Uncharacterized protein n=1 Tax=Pisolithus tinctorius Marx 270 TaxID=870435 RepID=A0A0C3PG52_PISTI|nr:hypothetical protein M404DRAFT_993896 [Pisolithus tinctorius Marx 270]
MPMPIRTRPVTSAGKKDTSQENAVTMQNLLGDSSSCISVFPLFKENCTCEEADENPHRLSTQ